MKTKTVIVSGFALFFLLALAFLFFHAFSGVTAPPTSSVSFNEALWGTWGVAIIIVAFIIFAGGTGILVLIGGGWRWE
jgi:hypothetical protein